MADRVQRDDAGAGLDRRRFLQACGLAGGFVVAAGLLPRGRHAAATANAATFNAFVRVADDDTVTVVIKHLDMGQGVTTGLTTIVAEEMDADWSQMRFENAPADATNYANLAWGTSQGTGGSSSIRNSWQQLREAGAAARAMLVGAAAKRWGVDAATVTVTRGRVHAGEFSATFGELAADAGAIEPASPPALKSPDTFTLIGHHVPRIDSASKSTGRALYTIDVTPPDAVHAAVLRAPRFGARVHTIDARGAKAVAGVVDVLEIPSGVAVVATSFWSALKGRDALNVTWQPGSGETRSSADLSALLGAKIDTPGPVAAERGDCDAAFAGAAKTIEADFEFPYLAHAALEPLNATVLVRGGGCEIWTGCQSQTRDQRTAADILGIEPGRVTIHTLYAGGSFGRRAVPDSDFVAEAVHVARAFGKPVPVKVQWTREDDMRGGRYRPVSLHRLRAALDADGALVAWTHRVVGQSFMQDSQFAGAVTNGVDRTLVEGARNLPYAVDHFRCDTHIVDCGVPTLWWRSVGHTHNAFATEVFFDHVARAAGRAPDTWRRELLAAHPRHLGVLDRALAEAGPPPAGERRGRGVAVHESFKSFVAEVADVTLNADGTFSVDRVTAAVDCGIAINPDIVRAQIEGGIGFGLSAALHEAVTLTNGEVNETNFDAYRLLRMADMPAVAVHIVPSTEAPTGVGEPGTPPIGPAVANALYAAGAKLVTHLPIGDRVSNATDG